MKNTVTLEIPATMNRRIGQAMHDYQMLADGDRVLIGLSGGIDSLVLTSVLAGWQKKAPISYSLSAITIDHEFWREVENGVGPQESIGSQVEGMQVEYHVEKSWELAEEERTCYQCARNRRSQLFEYARQHDYNKIAFGHHRDDLVETLFLNMLYSGNISTMVPRQELFDGNLHIIRPLAYLEKSEVMVIGNKQGLKAVANLCPLEDKTRRKKVRKILEGIYKQEPEAKKSIFASLSNVREGYLL
ncbi:ATP-binding protein [Desulfopila sp. IMCC35008]|uniref:tRNA lysidine(34) synthetase n=1 Tax=Desulfopila sp. IMCC35008 TaxID=2653858 RepID=UPI001F0FD004|nr:ATP-binding protein [Desulfopila sp. IMCC35008]